ncbi:MAG TPA: substrate-binding domain-containing protein [Alphaproteobacteria bacterium]|nr:substrate-binding domain-containing protein [Alphaproteobacteria bacterium]
MAVSSKSAKANARRRIAGLVACTLIAGIVAPERQAFAERSPVLRLGVTTTVENSGLLAHLLPRFTAATGIQVRAIVRGTGEVLRVARAGDVDVIIAHDPAGERAFLHAGHGTARRDLMRSYFVIVGPKSDPAGIAGLKSAPDALRKIAHHKARFISRGDDSGTHRSERRQWRAAGIDPHKPARRWYMEAGAGMGATLNVASGRGAYTFTDIGTWLAFRNRGALVALVTADGSLINVYGVTLVAPTRIGPRRARAARRFFRWISGPAGQRAIGRYRIDGRTPFTPATFPRP